MTRSEELRDVVKSRKFTVLCKAWEVRTTNVDLEAVYIAINQDLSKAKHNKAMQNNANQHNAKQTNCLWSTPILPTWARTSMPRKKRQPQRHHGVRSRAINHDREIGQ